MLAALNVPAETMPLASLYLRVFLLSMPSILLYNFEAAIFRSVGITRMPLQALAVSTVLNIGLDLIFVPVLQSEASGMVSAGTLSAASMGSAKISPSAMTTKPTSAIRIEVWTARLTMFWSLRPMALAITTLEPSM